MIRMDFMTINLSMESHVKPSSTFDGRVWWLRGVCLSVMIILVVGGGLPV